MSKQEATGDNSDVLNPYEPVRVGLQNSLLDPAPLFNIPLILFFFRLLFEIVLGMFKSFNSKRFLNEKHSAPPLATDFLTLSLTLC